MKQISLLRINSLQWSRPYERSMNSELVRTLYSFKSVCYLDARYNLRTIKVLWCVRVASCVVKSVEKRGRAL